MEAWSLQAAASSLGKLDDTAARSFIDNDTIQATDHEPQRACDEAAEPLVNSDTIVVPGHRPQRVAHGEQKNNVPSPARKARASCDDLLSHGCRDWRSGSPTLTCQRSYFRVRLLCPARARDALCCFLSFRISTLTQHVEGSTVVFIQSR